MRNKESVFAPDVEKIKSLRLTNGFSQEKVARGIGISAVFYRSIEQGRQEARFSTYAALADFYKIPLESLLIRRA